VCGEAVRDALAQDTDIRSWKASSTTQGGRAVARAEAEAPVQTLFACLGDDVVAQARFFFLARGK
jgi:hypothetical protein